MEEKKKKRIIALLLLISCVISACLFVVTPGSQSASLSSLADADSLIMSDLHRFNVADSQLYVASTPMDSIHIRKTYWVHVPPGLSKAQLHTEIHQTFYPFNIQSPAKVVFPQKDMTIYLMYHGTVFRSIVLETDMRLSRKQNYGSIILAFNGMPTQELLEKVISLGEPIPVALIVHSPMQANEMRKELIKQYSSMLFWLQDENGNSMLSDATLSESIPRLKNLQEAIPNASVLCFKNFSTMSSSDAKYVRSLANTSLNFVDASQALLLNADAGRPTFRQKLTTFANKARQDEDPVAIVMGSDEALDWLQEGLAEFKKAGLHIIRPQQTQF